MMFTELKELPGDAKPLPLEFEQKLARTILGRSTRRLRENAIAMLVHYSMREAFLYAGKCSKGRLTPNMLTSLSYLGLCKAAKNFKPGQLRFFGYAKIYVRSEVFRHFREISVVRNVPNERITEFGPIGWTVAYGGRPQTDNGEPATGRLKDGGDQRGGEKTAEFGFDEIHSAEVWSALLPRLRELLTPKEYIVITRHYIDELNFREIADEMGDSRSWAQALHVRALKKISQHRESLKQTLDV